jgi:hypothetical protein
MTPTEIEARFEEAASVLRRLPDPRPMGYFSTWPQVVRSAAEAYGWEPARTMRVPPTPQAISRMEECFSWLLWLDPDDARIVWLRAEGLRWKPICYRMGMSRATAWRRWAAALLTIANRLGRDEKTGASRARRSRNAPHSPA